MGVCATDWIHWKAFYHVQRNLQLQCRRQELLKLTAVVDFLGRESLPIAMVDSLDDANKDEQELGLSMKS